MNIGKMKVRLFGDEGTKKRIKKSWKKMLTRGEVFGIINRRSREQGKKSPSEWAEP